MFLEAIKRTNADEFPASISFEKRDYFSLLMIPLIFLNSFFFARIFHVHGIYLVLADTAFRGFLFLLICLIYGKMLKEHWKKFNFAKVQSWAVVIIGAIVFQILITYTRYFLPLYDVKEILQKENETDVITFPIILCSFGPVLTAFIEDIIFKYTLLYKLFIKNNIIRFLVVTLNSILFGLVHYYNFDGNLLATIRFMVAGLFLNLIFLWTRNIWHALLIHIVNNFMLSVIGLLFLYIMQQFFS
ncbi:type II CAAX endopeptidase family protein [Chryseobacterium sp. Chry.R1]|uniref:CPBP family intramembrane glutamic endopeptidase n=1 Tax=Chryseobacterium sp. Chry.R1 TaxID=3139392 RepID=UPI0031F7DE31